MSPREVGAGSPRDRYRSAVEALAGPLRQRNAGIEEAERALTGELREAAERVARATGRVEAAGAALREAHQACTEVDQTAGRIWLDVRAFHGRRGGSLGPLPDPEEVGSAHPASAPALLSRAARTLAQARRGELRIEPPAPVWLAMLIAGVLGALVLAGVGRAILGTQLEMQGDGRTAMTVLARISFLAAPFGGIPLGAFWLSRYGQPVTAKAFAWVFGTGIVVGCTLLALFGS